MKKLLSAAILLTMMVLLCACGIDKEDTYANAMSMYEAEAYEEAIEEFSKIENYQDSAMYIERSQFMLDVLGRWAATSVSMGGTELPLEEFEKAGVKFDFQFIVKKDGILKIKLSASVLNPPTVELEQEYHIENHTIIASNDKHTIELNYEDGVMHYVMDAFSGECARYVGE